VVGVTTGPIAHGAVLFYDKGCEFCHTISGLGGIRGPDLSFVGDRLNRDQIATRIYSGAENMPSYSGKISQTDLNDLLAFLESRRNLPPAGPVPPMPGRGETAHAVGPRAPSPVPSSPPWQ
jgi:ubiquinol-cytochrome c reductase cytochrome b subunit